MAAQVERRLETQPAVLIINKFGKAEAEGHGLRGVIVTAVAKQIPVIIGLPLKNVDVWRSFAGEFACEFSEDMAEIWHWLHTVSPMGRSRSIR